MMAHEKGGNGAAPELRVVELVLEFDGKKYALTCEKVAMAFNKAPAGKVSGPGSRYYIRMDDDLKSMNSVLAQIVPMKDKVLDGDIASRISELFRALGFEVRDRHRHHE